MLANKALSAAPSAVPVYVEDVFSTYLYRGTGSTLSINNGVDLSTKGGLVWGKSRNGAATAHWLFDTERGTTKYLMSNSLSAQSTSATTLTAFNTNGFTLGTSSFVNEGSDTSVNNYVSWTFAQQEKFFDVVTYTGNKASGRSIAHNLGSTPGCIIIKSATDTERWTVYHRSLTAVDYYLDLSETSAEGALANGISSVTSTSFTIGSNDRINSSGQTFVAYLFAHDAGGFGASGSDSVIKCGSFTTDGSGNATVTLDWEPQLVITKSSSTTSDWRMFDNMRGFTVSTDALLRANTSGAESTGDDYINPTATGFVIPANYSASQTFIYIAIRRGPMKTPTSATSVFEPIARSGTGSTSTVSTVLTDLVISHHRNNSVEPVFYDRLRGATKALRSSTTAAESTYSDGLTGFDSNSGYVLGADSSGGQINFSGVTYANWNLRRAPGFFDEVCYTGNGSARTITHNLGATPELMIVKSRSSSSYVWAVYNSSVGATKYLRLTSNIGSATESNIWNDTAPTSSVFTVGTGATVNENSGTYVAYLFASLTGVSKVGSYTGNGSSQTINCGFTAGARFVLIKRSDGNGDWVVFDSARGIVAGNDPYLELNTTDAEVTDKDAVDTDNSGFIVNETTGPNVNTNSATYIYLAIA
jgi:hypothetical protein